MNKHVSGTTVRMEVTFTLNSVLTDPTNVVATVRDAAGVSTNYTVIDDVEMTNPSIGIYRLELNVGEEGVWEFRFVGSGVLGTVNEAAEGRFEVPRSSFIT